MNALVRLFQLRFLPTSADVGLLVLRLWLGGSLVILHGWSKLITFSTNASTFPDPLGVGSTWSLTMAVLGEVLCSLLIVAGFVTRLAALGAATTMGVAFYSIHKLSLQGQGNGELAFVYLAGFVVLFVTGAGRFSFDGSGSRGGNVSKIKPQPSK